MRRATAEDATDGYTRECDEYSSRSHNHRSGRERRKPSIASIRSNQLRVFAAAGAIPANPNWKMLDASDRSAMVAREPARNARPIRPFSMICSSSGSLALAEEYRVQDYIHDCGREPALIPVKPLFHGCALRRVIRVPVGQPMLHT